MRTLHPTLLCMLSLAAADERALYLRNMVITLVTSSDPNVVAERNALQLPAALASDVMVVTDERVCSRAARAHAEGVTSPPPTGPTGQVYVVKVGTRYVVQDPAYTVGEWVRESVQSTTYKVLARAGG